MRNVSSSETLVHCSVAAGVHRANETLVKTGRMGRSCIRCDRRGPALPEHRNVALRLALPAVVQHLPDCVRGPDQGTWPVDDANRLLGHVVHWHGEVDDVMARSDLQRAQKPTVRTHAGNFGLAGAIGGGSAIEVTAFAGKHFGGSRVAIETQVYERHVGWPSKAIRTHALYLEEGARLDGLISAATRAGRHEAPAEFAYSTVDADGDTVVPKRQSFTLMRVNDGDRTGWLITQ